MKKLVGTFVLVWISAWLGALPGQDPAIVTGTLDNGVRYSLQRNAKPENRVEMRLTVQVGSVQETEAELGLAHLVEHLQFEGTQRFAPQEIVSFLESNGMKFGNDLNAQTGFTDTQYFLDLPADRPEILVKGLTVLEDWAHGPKITPEVLEKEKNIVAEELRVRMESVQGRVTRFVLASLLEGTAYQDRLPIGDMAVLRKVTVAQAEAFVRRWYTPRALSLQIVGDFDPRAFEAVLRATMTRPFAASGDAPPRPPRVPAYPAPSTHAFQDPELGANLLVWNRVFEVDPLDLVEARRLELLNFLVSFTLSKRFTELTQSAEPPFLQASMNASPEFSGAWLQQAQLVVRDGAAQGSLEAFLTELRRLSVHGLGATDLELALGEYRSIVEAQYAQRTNLTHSQRGQALAAAALAGIPVLSDDDEYALRLELARGTTLDDVNRALAAWLDLSGARLLVLTTGRDVGMPTEAQIASTTAQIAASEVAQGKQRAVRPLFTSEPKAGKVTKVEKVTGTPVTKWTLSNGLVVWVYPNEFAKNEVQLRAVAPGGLSRFDDKAYLSAALAPLVFSNTGVGDLSVPELTDTLTGHQVSANAQVDESGASVVGWAVKADVELLFQLVHRKLAPARRDPAAEASLMKQIEQSLANQQDTPQRLYQNEIQRVITGGAARNRPLTVERLSEVVLDEAAGAYRSLFDGGAGFSFVLTGDFDEAAVRPLVETYLGSLKAGASVKVVDRGIRPLGGPVKSVVQKGRDDKAVVTLLLPVALGYNTQTRLTAEVLQEALDIRLREVVRQDKEGTYGVTVDVSLARWPYPQALTFVQFTCDRARQDELAAAVVAELGAWARGDLDQTVVDKALEIRKKALESDRKTNDWWSRTLTAALVQGDDVAVALDPLTVLAKVNRAAVLSLAKSLINPARALTVVLNPEAPVP